MKSLILALALGTSLASAEELKKAPETVRVCVYVKDKAGQPVIDPKTKQPKQNCRTVKKHNKLENATAVPDGKKK
jgi:hypothetical protein